MANVVSIVMEDAIPGPSVRNCHRFFGSKYMAFFHGAKLQHSGEGSGAPSLAP